jgi:O-antigen/teichoic acid export membrane protein
VGEGHIRDRVFRGTASNLGGKLIALVSTFVLTPFILHTVGPSQFGLWVLVGSLAGNAWLLDFGLSTAVTKYVAEHLARGEPERARSVVATAVNLYAGLALIAVALGLAIAPVVPDWFTMPAEDRATATPVVQLTAMWVGLSLFSMPLAAALRGLQRYDVLNLIATVSTLVSAAATVVVVLLGGGLIGIAALGIPLVLVEGFATVFVIRTLAPDLQFGWRGASRATARLMLSFSWSLFASHVGKRLQVRMDEVVIGAALWVGAITPYTLARKLGELVREFADQAMQVLLPLASELHAQDDSARLRSLYTASSRLTLALTLPIACTLIILPGAVLTAWAGAAYADSATIVAILTVAAVIEISARPATSIFRGLERHQPLAVASLCSGLANVALSVLLVHPFGILGVALGTLIPTMAVSLGFALPYAMRVMGVGAREAIREIYLPVLVPLLPTVIVLHVLRVALEPTSATLVILVAGTGALVYAAGYLALGASQSERLVWRDLALSTWRVAGLAWRRS